MNILIADDNNAYRPSIKSYIHKLWPEALVYEESNLDSVIRDVFDINYELLILATDIPGNEQLEDFVKQAVKYTKVIIFSDDVEDDAKANRLIQIGADTLMLKSAMEEEVISTLLFVFDQS